MCTKVAWSPIYFISYVSRECECEIIQNWIILETVLIFCSLPASMYKQGTQFTFLCKWRTLQKNSYPRNIISKEASVLLPCNPERFCMVKYRIIMFSRFIYNVHSRNKYFIQHKWYVTFTRPFGYYNVYLHFTKWPIHPFIFKGTYCFSQDDEITGVNSTLAVLALLGGILCIVCSALACVALCNGKTGQQQVKLTWSQKSRDVKPVLV